VIRVKVRDTSVALITGDIDEVGVDHLLSHFKQINAAVMVFPHHGGSRGHVRRSDFTEKLCGAVSPKMVILSVGRGRYNTPDPEVIRTIRRTLPKVWIACTQLSTSCAIDLPVVRSSHLARVFSQGREKNHCCAGTVVVNLEENRVREPDREGHESFISNHIPTPMCLEKRNKGEVSERDVRGRSCRACKKEVSSIKKLTHSN
jgi:competence protein ComEC